MEKLNFSYDEAGDILTIEGIKYSGELFRAWAADGLPLNTHIEIIERKDGMISFRRYYEPDPLISERSNVTLDTT